MRREIDKLRAIVESKERDAKNETKNAQRYQVAVKSHISKDGYQRDAQHGVFVAYCSTHPSSCQEKGTNSTRCIKLDCFAQFYGAQLDAAGITDSVGKDSREFLTSVFSAHDKAIELGSLVVPSNQTNDPQSFKCCHTPD